MPMKTRRFSWRSIAVVLGCVPLLAPPAFAADDEAAALLAKHKAFVGWELGDGSIKSLRIDGTISKRDKDGRLTPTERVAIVRTGLAYRRRSTSVKTGGASEDGFSGSSFWYSTDNGFTVPLVSENRPSMLTRSVFLNEATTQLPATIRKHDSVDGTAVVVLREVPAGHPFDLYIDPATGAYKRLVLDPMVHRRLWSSTRTPRSSPAGRSFQRTITWTTATRTRTRRSAPTRRFRPTRLRPRLTLRIGSSVGVTSRLSTLNTASTLRPS